MILGFKAYQKHIPGLKKSTHAHGWNYIPLSMQILKFEYKQSCLQSFQFQSTEHKRTQKKILQDFPAVDSSRMLKFFLVLSLYSKQHVYAVYRVWEGQDCTHSCLQQRISISTSQGFYNTEYLWNTNAEICARKHLSLVSETKYLLLA